MGTLEYVSLNVGGYAYRSWTRATVSYGAKKAARQFAFTLTDNTSSLLNSSDQWSWMPGIDCTVTASAGNDDGGGGDLMVTGILDSMTPSYDATNHSVEISGRSKSKDSIDSAAEHPTGEMRNQTPLQIAQALDQQGTGYSSDGSQMDPVPLFRVNPGESVMAAVDRVARKQRLLLIGQADGSVQIASGGTSRVHPPLIEGRNIIGASAVFSEQGTHSTYKVKGQKVYGSDKSSLRITQSSDNAGQKRNRPKHIIPESDVDESQGQKRADHHRDRQQGESITAKVKVQGWHDDNGMLYVPNTLIYIWSPMLKLSMDLLLSEVSCTMDDKGSFTELSFVQPSSYNSSASGGAKADPVWANPN